MHSRDAAVFNGEDVPDLGIGENVALEVFNELMNSDLCLVSSEIDHFLRLYVGIEGTPLTSPIGSYFFLANYRTTL